MKQHTLAAAFTLFQLFLLFAVSNLWLLPIVASLLAIASFSEVWTRLYCGSQPYLRGVVLAVLALVYVARVVGLLQMQQAYGVFELFAISLICAQVYVLQRRHKSKLPDYFPGLGILTTAFIFAQPDVGLRREVMILLSGFISLFVLLLLSPASVSDVRLSIARRDSRSRVVLFLAVFIAFVGWFFTGILERTTPHATQVLIKVSETRSLTYQGSTLQYVSEGGLNSIQQQQLTDSLGVALTIYSDRAPGYLRGASFDFFDGRRWRDYQPNARTQIAPTRSPAIGSVAKGAAFLLQEKLSDKRYEMVVESDPRRGSQIFQSLGTAVIAGEPTSTTLLIDSHGIARSGISNRAPYHLLVNIQSDERPSEYYLKQISKPVYDNDGPTLKALSREIVGDAATTTEKIARVEKVFRDNFDYSLYQKRNNIQDAMSPLADFLLRQRRGHCEYFATATCALLRFQGVPCRFTVGYRVYDMNEDEEWLHPIDGLPPDPTNLPQGCSFAPRCKFATDACRKESVGMYKTQDGHDCRCCRIEAVMKGED